MLEPKSSRPSLNLYTKFKSGIRLKSKRVLSFWPLQSVTSLLANLDIQRREDAELLQSLSCRTKESNVCWASNRWLMGVHMNSLAKIGPFYLKKFIVSMEKFFLIWVVKMGHVTCVKTLTWDIRLLWKGKEFCLKLEKQTAWRKMDCSRRVTLQ